MENNLEENGNKEKLIKQVNVNVGIDINKTIVFNDCTYAPIFALNQFKTLGSVTIKQGQYGGYIEINDYTFQPLVKLGINSWIFQGVTQNSPKTLIGAGTKIGDYSFIHGAVNIDGMAIIGNNTFIDMNCMIGKNIEIIDNCNIKSFTTIDKNTFIMDNVNIGESSKIGVEVGFEKKFFKKRNINPKTLSKTKPKINDIIKDKAISIKNNFTKTYIGSNTVIEKNCIVEKGANVRNEVIIGEFSKISEFACIHPNAVLQPKSIVERKISVCEKN